MSATCAPGGFIGMGPARPGLSDSSSAGDPADTRRRRRFARRPSMPVAGSTLLPLGGSVGAGPRPRTVALMSRGAARPLTRGTTFRAEQARRTPATAAGSPRGATSRPAQRPHRDASACGPPRRCSSPPRSPRPMVVVHFTTFAQDARRGRVPVNAEVEQRRSRPSARVAMPARASV